MIESDDLLYRTTAIVPLEKERRLEVTVLNDGRIMIEVNPEPFCDFDWFVVSAQQWDDLVDFVKSELAKNG